ncbi:MAG: arabinogalactan endo-1,4-beta-galactosidase [Bacteroidetes bacterium]|nr:MAG: arabinogalactan endo-1,4-beta-galactosidase [Bacteroidota bacterium]
MKTSSLAIVSVFILFSSACKKSGSNVQLPPMQDSAFFAKGADVSWLSQMEANNYSFYDPNGNKNDCLQILKGLGVNSIRLRAWVNPSDGWCNTKDLVEKATRAKNLGLRIMIDFHYSDSWADPGKQNKPLAWDSLSTPDLVTTLHDYTHHVLDTLRSNGIIPQWVQVGNETNDGMLWEDGRASTHMSTFANLVTAGYNACKEISDSIQVIVHISNGYDNTLFRWVFDGLTANGGKFDIIGMSLYPSSSGWQSLNTQCLSNMTDLASRYGKPIMISEVGMDVTAAADCELFLKDLITKAKSLPGNKGLGVFYWEPEAYNWKGYPNGAFDINGKPTVALSAFSN